MCVELSPKSPNASPLKGGKAKLAVLKRKLDASASGKKDMTSDANDTDDGSLNATIQSSSVSLHVPNLIFVGDMGCEDDPRFKFKIVIDDEKSGSSLGTKGGSRRGSRSSGSKSGKSSSDIFSSGSSSSNNSSSKSSKSSKSSSSNINRSRKRKKDCRWIANNVHGFRIPNCTTDEYCGIGLDDGRNVKDYCPKACDTCPSISPTVTPIILSMNPSAALSDVPSLSMKPSVAPSDLPSLSANPSAAPIGCAIIVDESLCSTF